MTPTTMTMFRSAFNCTAWKPICIECFKYLETSWTWKRSSPPTITGRDRNLLVKQRNISNIFFNKTGQNLKLKLAGTTCPEGEMHCSCLKRSTQFHNKTLQEKISISLECGRRWRVQLCDQKTHTTRTYFPVLAVRLESTCAVVNYSRENVCTGRNQIWIHWNRSLQFNIEQETRIFFLFFLFSFFFFVRKMLLFCACGKWTFVLPAQSHYVTHCHWFSICMRVNQTTLPPHLLVAPRSGWHWSEYFHQYQDCRLEWLQTAR